MWIQGAIVRDVHELFVRVEISKLPIHVQTCMFTSERLRSLELDCSICISSEIDVSLPRLEHLKLISVYFQGSKAFNKLLDGCPVLTHLVIKMDIGKMIQCGHINTVLGLPYNVDGTEFRCKISSAVLTNLQLCVYDKYVPTRDVFCRVRFDAPLLKYIGIRGRIHSIFIQQKSLAFLGDAKIQVIGCDTDETSCYNTFVDAVSTFGCAKTLILNDHFIWSLSLATIKMSTKLNGLTRLEVSVDWNHWSPLQDLIELADNLQVLIVNKGRNADGIHINNSNWTNPEVIPICLSNSLRTVLIGTYQGYLDELAMVEYIIKHGSVLKLVQIGFGESINNDFKRKYEVVQQICAVPRKSPPCVVKFLDYGVQFDAV